MLVALCERRASILAETEEIVAEQLVVTGFQVYVIEQWIPDRQRVLKTVTVYTGNSFHKLKISVFRFKYDSALLKELAVFGVPTILKTQLELANVYLYVANPANIPPNLKLSLIPNRDVDASLQIAFLNNNLMKLGCLEEVKNTSIFDYPTLDASSKFYKEYQLHTSFNLEFSVFQLVRIIQVSLEMMGFLEWTHSDGILCNDTENALNSYSEDPMSLCKAISIITRYLMYCNRCEVIGMSVFKDPFISNDSLKQDIRYFQEALGINATGQLDINTITAIELAYSRLANFSIMKNIFKLKKKNDFVDEEYSELSNLLKETNNETINYFWLKKKGEFVEFYDSPTFIIKQQERNVNKLNSSIAFLMTHHHYRKHSNTAGSIDNVTLEHPQFEQKLLNMSNIELDDHDWNPIVVRKRSNSCPNDLTRAADVPSFEFLDEIIVPNEMIGELEILLYEEMRTDKMLQKLTDMETCLDEEIVELRSAAEKTRKLWLALSEKLSELMMAKNDARLLCQDCNANEGRLLLESKVLNEKLLEIKETLDHLKAETRVPGLSLYEKFRLNFTKFLYFIDSVEYAVFIDAPRRLFHG